MNKEKAGLIEPNAAARFPDLREALEKLVGKECWHVGAGVNTGSNVVFDFGRKLRRAKPLRNPYVSEDVRKYVGEVGLYVTCSWRLDAEREVLCGSRDDNSEDGPMIQGLSRLEGLRVLSVSVSAPGLDLVVGFEGGLTLRVFCDEVSEDGDGNYAVFLPGVYIEVGNRSVLGWGVSELTSGAPLALVPGNTDS